MIAGRGVSTPRFLSHYARARGLRLACRLGFKVLRRPNTFSAWLSELESFRARFGLDETGLQSYVGEPLRPFMRAGLTVEQRLQISRSHHAAIGSLLSPHVIRNIWAHRLTKLGVVEGRRDSRFALWLGAAEYVREGGLEIIFARETTDGSAPMPLARTSFSLGTTRETNNKRTLLIGGLQGGPRCAGKRAIIDATRDLRGMRPKTAVAVAAQAFAEFARCQAIWAVSDETHVINERGKKTREQKAASYNSFWQERQGKQQGFFGYELPMGEADNRPERKAVFDCTASAFAVSPNLANR